MTAMTAGPQTAFMNVIVADLALGEVCFHTARCTQFRDAPEADGKDAPEVDGTDPADIMLGMICTFLVLGSIAIMYKELIRKKK